MRIRLALGKHFLPPAGCGSIFLQKVVEMLEEVVISWWKVRWIWCMRQNYITQIFQLLKHCLCNMGSGIVVAKNWALSVESFLDSESCRGSGGLQTTKQWLRPFYGISLVWGSALKLLLSPITKLVVTSCHKKFTFHCMSQSNWDIVHCFSIE